MASFEADTSSLQRFAKRIIRSAPKEVKAELRKAVRAAGQLVADDAKPRTTPRIAKTIRVGAAGATATIRAGNAKTPEASLLEGDGTPGTFRHPLFGDKDHWYEQARQPYLHPALEAKRSDAEDLLAAAAQTAVEKVVKE